MSEGLLESDAPDDPMDLLNSWVSYAQELGFHNANAMTVSTVNQQMEPSSRNVLMRGQIDDGLVFYTNYESAKATDLENNNKNCGRSAGGKPSSNERNEPESPSRPTQSTVLYDSHEPIEHLQKPTFRTFGTDVP